MSSGTPDFAQPLSVQGDVQDLPMGSQIVTAIQGRAVSPAGPLTSQVLVWSGETNSWVPIYLFAALVENAADKSKASAQVFDGALSTGPTSASFSGSQTNGAFVGTGGAITSFNSVVSTVLAAGLTTDTTPEIQVNNEGLFQWAGAASSVDTQWGRTAAGVLALSEGLAIGYSAGTGSASTSSNANPSAVSIATGTGKITSGAAVASAASHCFNVTCGAVAVTDTIIVNLVNGGTLTSSLYTLMVSRVVAGGFEFVFVNNSSASITPVFNYAVIKGASS